LWVIKAVQIAIKTLEGLDNNLRMAAPTTDGEHFEIGVEKS
jgi:hypothetical protein